MVPTWTEEIFDLRKFVLGYFRFLPKNIEMLIKFPTEKVAKIVL